MNFIVNKAIGGRDKSCDIISGFCIIHMILGHISCVFTNLCDNQLWKASCVVFSCYMPWFFFKSGMYYKGAKTSDVLKKGTKRLIVPYCIFSIVGVIVSLIPSLYYGNFQFSTLFIAFKEILFFQSTMGNNALWFLLALFVCNVIISLVSSYQTRFFIMLTMFIILSCFTAHINLSYTTWDNICSGGAFLFTGYFFNKKGLLKKKMMLFASIIAFLMIYIFINSSVEMYVNQLLSGFYLLWFIKSVAMIVILYNFTSYIQKVSIFKVFSSIGKHSMVPYVCHWPLLILTQLLLRKFNIGDYNSFAIMIIVNILILPIIYVLLKELRLLFIVGEK